MSKRGDRVGLWCPVCGTQLRIIYLDLETQIYCPKKGCKYNEGIKT